MASDARIAEVQREFTPLMKRAREEGLWFHLAYGSLWMDPDSLEEAHRRGSLLWSKENWILRPTSDYHLYIDGLTERATQLLDEANAHLSRISERGGKDAAQLG